MRLLLRVISCGFLLGVGTAAADPPSPWSQALRPLVTPSKTRTPPCSLPPKAARALKAKDWSQAKTLILKSKPWLAEGVCLGQLKALYNEALLYIEAKQTENAVQVLSLGIDLLSSETQSFEQWFGIGLALVAMQTEKWEAAHATLSDVVQIYPQNTVAQDLLKWSKTQLQQRQVQLKKVLPAREALAPEALANEKFNLAELEKTDEFVHDMIQELRERLRDILAQERELFDEESLDPSQNEEQTDENSPKNQKKSGKSQKSAGGAGSGSDGDSDEKSESGKSKKHKTDVKAVHPDEDYVVQPPRAGLYATGGFSRYDSETSEWSYDEESFRPLKEKPQFMSDDFLRITVNTEKVLRRSGDDIVIPLAVPYGYAPDPASVRFEAGARGELRKDPFGFWIVVYRGDIQKLHYRIRRLKTEFTFRDEKPLPEASQRMKYSLNDRLLRIVEPYSKDPKALHSVMRVYTKYTTNNSDVEAYVNSVTGQARFDRIVDIFFQEDSLPDKIKGKGLDCDVWSELFIILLRHFGRPAVLAAGFVKEEPHLKVNSGHGWVRVWDAERQRWMDYNTPVQGGPGTGTRDQKDFVGSSGLVKDKKKKAEKSEESSSDSSSDSDKNKNSEEKNAEAERSPDGKEVGSGKGQGGDAEGENGQAQDPRESSQRGQGAKKKPGAEGGESQGEDNESPSDSDEDSQDGAAGSGKNGKAKPGRDESPLPPMDDGDDGGDDTDAGGESKEASKSASSSDKNPSGAGPSTQEKGGVASQDQNPTLPGDPEAKASREAPKESTSPPPPQETARDEELQHSEQGHAGNGQYDPTRTSYTGQGYIRKRINTPKTREAVKTPGETSRSASGEVEELRTLLDSVERRASKREGHPQIRAAEYREGLIAILARWSRALEEQKMNRLHLQALESASEKITSAIAESYVLRENSLRKVRNYLRARLFDPVREPELFRVELEFHLGLLEGLLRDALYDNEKLQLSELMAAYSQIATKTQLQDQLYKTMGGNSQFQIVIAKGRAYVRSNESFLYRDLNFDVEKYAAVKLGTLSTDGNLFAVAVQPKGETAWKVLVNGKEWSLPRLVDVDSLMIVGADKTVYTSARVEGENRAFSAKVFKDHEPLLEGRHCSLEVPPSTRRSDFVHLCLQPLQDGRERVVLAHEGQVVTDAAGAPLSLLSDPKAHDNVAVVFSDFGDTVIKTVQLDANGFRAIEAFNLKDGKVAQIRQESQGFFHLFRSPDGQVVFSSFTNMMAEKFTGFFRLDPDGTWSQQDPFTILGRPGQSTREALPGRMRWSFSTPYGYEVMKSANEFFETPPNYRATFAGEGVLKAATERFVMLSTTKNKGGFRRNTIHAFRYNGKGEVEEIPYLDENDAEFMPVSLSEYAWTPDTHHSLAVVGLEDDTLGVVVDNFLLAKEKYNPAGATEVNGQRVFVSAFNPNETYPVPARALLSPNGEHYLLAIAEKENETTSRVEYLLDGQTLGVSNSPILSLKASARLISFETGLGTFSFIEDPSFEARVQELRLRLIEKNDDEFLKQAKNLLQKNPESWRGIDRAYLLQNFVFRHTLNDAADSEVSLRLRSLFYENPERLLSVDSAKEMKALAFLQAMRENIERGKGFEKTHRTQIINLIKSSGLAPGFVYWKKRRLQQEMILIRHPSPADTAEAEFLQEFSSPSDSTSY